MSNTNPFDTQPGETAPLTDEDFFSVMVTSGPDGTLSAEQKDKLRARVAGILGARDLTPEQRKKAASSLDAILTKLGSEPLWKASGRTVAEEWARMAKNITTLREALIPMAKAQEQAVVVYMLGKIGGTVESAIALLETASEQLAHIIDCDCHGEPHEKPTEPPPAEGKG
jgi:hypothetical protein